MYIWWGETIKMHHAAGILGELGHQPNIMASKCKANTNASVAGTPFKAAIIGWWSRSQKIPAERYI
jgi:hypothetical protein